VLLVEDEEAVLEFERDVLVGRRGCYYLAEHGRNQTALAEWLV